MLLQFIYGLTMGKRSIDGVQDMSPSSKEIQPRLIASFQFYLDPVPI